MDRKGVHGQRNEKQAQINGLKNLLEQSDHDILEAIESVFACDNLLDVPQVIIDAGKSIAGIVKQRVEWRKEIRRLTAEIEAEKDA